MSYTITLEYTCGCQDAWSLGLEPTKDQLVMQCKEPCQPEHCDTCTPDHPCRERTGIEAYHSVEWSEIDGRPRRVTRMRGAGIRKWEEI